MGSVRKLVVAIGLLALLAGALASCAGDATQTQPTVTPTDEGNGGGGSPGAAENGGRVEQIRVKVSDGSAHPSLGRVEVPVGSTVRLTVESDVRDEIHVHSYEEELTLRPDEPGTVQFTTGVPGLFEVESHESGKVLFYLQVS